VLMGSARLGLGRVEAAARVLAPERFNSARRWRVRRDSCAAVRMDSDWEEGAVGSLLDDDRLSTSREETVLEAVVPVGWMKGAGDELQGRGLLRKIRYCVLDLAADARLLAAHADAVCGVLGGASSHQRACQRLDSGVECGDRGVRLEARRAHGLSVVPGRVGDASRERVERHVRQGVGDGGWGMVGV
jgi:hypothetical protein